MTLINLKTFIHNFILTCIAIVSFSCPVIGSVLFAHITISQLESESSDKNFSFLVITHFFISVLIWTLVMESK